MRTEVEKKDERVTEILFHIHRYGSSLCCRAFIVGPPLFPGHYVLHLQVREFFQP